MYEISLCLATSMGENSFFFFASMISEASRGSKRLGLFAGFGALVAERSGLDTAGEACE